MGKPALLVKRDGGYKNCGLVYRFRANPGRPRGGIVPPAPVLAPGPILRPGSPVRMVFFLGQPKWSLAKLRNPAHHLVPCQPHRFWASRARTVFWGSANFLLPSAIKAASSSSMFTLL